MEFAPPLLSCMHASVYLCVQQALHESPSALTAPPLSLPRALPAVAALPVTLPGSPEVHCGGGDDDGEQSEGEGEGEGEGDDDCEGSPTDCLGSGGLNKSRYRGVSYDRKKAKWRVQIKVGVPKGRLWGCECVRTGLRLPAVQAGRRRPARHGPSRLHPPPPARCLTPRLPCPPPPPSPHPRQVAALGKSGVSVGYFDTEEAAARAYDRAAIGLLGRDHPNLQTNFDSRDYAGEAIPPLSGKSREEVRRAGHRDWMHAAVPVLLSAAAPFLL